MSNETAIEKAGQQTLLAFMKKNERCFKSVLPKHLNQERWAWLIVNSIRQNPALAGVTPMSFINSVMLAANIGLEIRRDSAYLLPFKQECTLVIDYRGKMELARRAGVGAIHTELVRDGDEFDYGFDRDGLLFKWRPSRDAGEVMAGFCSSRVNGEHQVTIMYLSEIEAIRRRSKSGKGHMTFEQVRAVDVDALPYRDRVPWVTDWDQMALKTLAHRAAKYWPQSSALLIASGIDNAADAGQPMPVAEGLENAMMEIDPADNRPMVDGGGESYEQQREAIQSAGATELAKAEARRTGPPVSKGQVDTILAAAKRYSLSEEAMRAVLTAHHATSVTQLRQSDFDSVCAAIEERAT